MSGECAGAVSGLVRSVDVRPSSKGITPTPTIHTVRRKRKLRHPQATHEEVVVLLKKTKKNKEEEAQRVLLERLPHPLLIMSGSRAGHREVQDDQTTPGGRDRPTHRPTHRRFPEEKASLLSILVFVLSPPRCAPAGSPAGSGRPPPRPQHIISHAAAR